MKCLNEIEEPKVRELGGKGAALAALTSKGFNVPRGFVVTSQAFFEFLRYNELSEKIEKLVAAITEDNKNEVAEKARNYILKGKVPQSLSNEVEIKLNLLSGRTVAVRSSCISEDSSRASFAGMFSTFLNIKMSSPIVLETIKKCWASLLNGRAVAYRIKKNCLIIEGMAVIVQEMIQAEISGVTFTANPDTKSKSNLLIEATWGLGEALVSGKITPDTYIVDKNNLRVIRKTLGRKTEIIMPFGENGTKTIEVSEDKKLNFCLKNTQISKLAKDCIRVEKLFQYPQDIEWCIWNGKSFIIQSRAITSLR